MSRPLLQLEDVVRHFRTAQGVVRAVDGVSLEVGRRESVGLVGESGSGKSTLARIALRLYDLDVGMIRFDGEDLTRLHGDRLRRKRTQFQMVFQDPISSLNPRMRVADIIGEPLRELLGLDRAARRARAAEALDLVHLAPSALDAYARELSGGMAQRVGIARALAVHPGLVVADEPVSSLDVSVAAQIINLMAELQDREDVSYLFISHDLGVVRHVCDRVAVMYLGRIVESGPTERLFTSPQHPYTASLISATPGVLEGGGRRERIILRGEVPDPTDVPSGCRFHTRCPIGPTARPGRQICVEVDPELVAAAGGGSTACHFPEDVVPVLVRRDRPVEVGTPRPVP